MQANVVQLDPIGRLWSRVERAMAKGHEAYIEFAQALAELSAAGITQEEIAKRCDMTQSGVAHTIAVGKDKRIITNRNNSLPRGQRALYLLTTLNDEDFEVFARSEVTEREIAEHKAAKKRPTAKPEKPFKIGGVEFLVDRFKIQMPSGGAERKTLRAKIKEETGLELPSYFLDRDQAEQCAGTVAAVFADKEQARPKLSETAEKKLQRALAIEMKRLQTSFDNAIEGEIAKRLPDLRAQLEHQLAEMREEAARYAHLSAGITKKISVDEYKFLLNMLHPDRQPEDRRERFNLAFQIVKRLREYAEA